MILPDSLLDLHCVFLASRPFFIMPTQPNACEVLRYGSAVANFLFLAFSILNNSGNVERKELGAKRTPKLLITLLGYIAVSYIIEGITGAAQEFDFSRSQAQIFHVVSLFMIWCIVGVRQVSYNISRHELLGTLWITFVFEVPLLALSSFRQLGYLGPTFELVCQASRILVLLCLLASTRHRWVRNKTGSGEESQPFLRRSDQSEEISYGTEPILGQPYVEDDNSFAGDSEDESDVDSEDDPEMRKIRKKRLQETGGWWNYFKDFSIFLPYLIPRQDRKVQACLVVNLLCLTCNRFLHILIPRQLGIITDKILAKEAPYEALGIWLLLSLLSGESGLGLIQELAKIPVKQFSFRQISNAAFRHVMSLDMEFHAERDSAEVMKAIEQGGALTTLLETVVIDIAPDIFDLIVAAFFLYWKFNAYVSLAMIVASISYVTAEVFTSSWNIPYRRRVTKAEREQARVMHQAVQGWQTVLYFNKFAFERRRYGEVVESYLTADRTWSKRDAFFKAFTELWIPATFFGLSCLILYDISQGRASAGDFVFFIQYWETLIWPLKLLSNQYKWLMADLVAAERLLVLLQTKPNVIDKENAHDLGPVKGHVEFKNVNFSYDSRQTTIKDVSISAKPGDTIALVGTTGAGKSTILKLLLRFYDATSGQIEIDGRDICDITLSSLREVIGVVPQDPLLFNASVMENLRYARPSATDEEVFAACRAAAIHDKILTFADCYNTQVGEQGVKLSRGELQRIAIARVFLKDPPIFILDEATSAIDTNTESEIQTALDVLKGRRTTFVIAHRLSTIVEADQILVVDEGSIVESGTHQELLKKEGRYNSLWTKQIGGGLEGKKSKIVEESSGFDDSLI